MELHPQYIIDDQAQKKAVILPLEEWQQLMEALEMLEDIQLYDKARDEESLPWAEAKRLLETEQ